MAVSGLTEIGIGVLAGGIEFVLVVGTEGRCVVAADGRLVARDHTERAEDWYDPIGLTAAGIGPVATHTVRLAGLAGGGLPVSTADGWRVVRYPVDWPDERIILQPPGADVLWPGHETGCVELLGPTAHDIRAAGFAPTGRLLAIATAGETRLYRR